MMVTDFVQSMNIPLAFIFPASIHKEPKVGSIVFLLAVNATTKVVPQFSPLHHFFHQRGDLPVYFVATSAVCSQPTSVCFTVLTALTRMFRKGSGTLFAIRFFAHLVGFRLIQSITSILRQLCHALD